VGEIFGHYRLDRLLGRGGFGEVWQAEDTNLDRVVALKRLNPSLQSDSEALARFRREARAAARLRHPHIVRVHNSGVIDGRHFLDTEFVEGVDLDRLLAQGRLPVPRILTIIDQVASALDAAHALDRPSDQRMVHRDVKPANVLVETRSDGSDHVYLADFGIARALVPGTRITAVGEVAGTPAYMAPELWEEDGSDHRVDVYSLAVMLYQLLTGTLPFERTTLEALVRAHLMADVPAASTADPGLPAAVDDVLRRGMAKDPDDRYATAPELAAAARAALSPVPIGGVPTGTAPPRTGNSGSGGPNATLALRPPAVNSPDPPDRPPPPPPPPPPSSESGIRAYFGSAPHYTGLAGVALIIPLVLAGVVHLDWAVFPVAALLYALGAIGSVAVRRRPPNGPSIGG
jgi:serine/threonine protein kinase